MTRNSHLLNPNSRGLERIGYSVGSLSLGHQYGFSSVHAIRFLTGCHALIVTETESTLCRTIYCKCHLRNLPLSTIYFFLCYSWNLVLKYLRVLWMLYTGTLFIGNLFFLFLGTICIDKIYFLIYLHFAWIEPYSLKYIHILPFNQINFLLRKYAYFVFHSFYIYSESSLNVVSTFCDFKRNGMMKPILPKSDWHKWELNSYTFDQHYNKAMLFEDLLQLFALTPCLKARIGSINLRGYGNCSGLGSLSRPAEGVHLGQLHLSPKACHLGFLWPWRGKATKQYTQRWLEVAIEKPSEFHCGDIDLNFVIHLILTFFSSFIRFNNTRSHMKGAKSLPWVYSVVGMKDRSFCSWKNLHFFLHLSWSLKWEMESPSLSS